MGIKKDYLKEAVMTAMKIDPSLDKEEVERIISMMMKEGLSDPSIHMDNNVTGAEERISLSELCNWLDKKKPVISGNATFYEQPDVVESPTSNMLRELKGARKRIKKEMFQAKDAGNMDLYEQLDLAQLNAKVIMNAEYGASGAPTAAFYTKYSPAATTLMAQSIITTMAAFFEGFVGDNMKFFHINECIDWMNKIREKKEEIPDWIIRPSLEEVKYRIKVHFLTYNMNDDKIIDGYLDNCKERELIYIFYANNLKEFIIRHKKMKDLLSFVISTLPNYVAAEKEVPEGFRDRFQDVEKYNKWISKEMFLDPYDIPKTIKTEMTKLIELMDQFCFVEYLTPDSIVKLNNHKRNTILLVDTDSNVINADIFVSFILDTVFPGESFTRTRLYNDMICVNILAAIVDSGVIKLLDFYGRTRNMNPDARKELGMKNEFMFRRFFLMNKKKRYAASTVLREGNIMIPFKPEIKGLDFIKAGVTEEVTERFTHLLEKYILFSDDLQIHELMRELKRFEGEIYQDLKRGGTRFLKPQTYKSEGAYKKKWIPLNDKDPDGAGEWKNRAWSIPVFRAAAIWNELYPLEKIYSLDRVKIIKLRVTGLMDLDPIQKSHPDDYKHIVDKIYHHGNKDIVTTGLKVIAIPNQLTSMPSWITELIDYDTIISDVMGSFRSVLEALRVEEIRIKTPHGRANVISSLISI